MPRKGKFLIGLLFIATIGICAVVICNQTIAYSPKARLYDIG